MRLPKVSPGLGHKLPGIFQLFLELEDKQKSTEYLEVLLRYLAGSVNDLTEDELKESVSKILIEGGDMMATIAENWMEKGIEKGMEKGKLETARELLKYGVSTDIIFQSTGIPLKKLEKIKDNLSKH